MRLIESYSDQAHAFGDQFGQGGQFYFASCTLTTTGLNTAFKNKHSENAAPLPEQLMCMGVTVPHECKKNMIPKTGVASAQ